MKTENYKGRRLKVIAGRGRDCGYTLAYVNGIDFSKSLESEDSALRILRGYIDDIDSAPIDGGRWAAYWYAPGTCDLCQHGHPCEIGGECRHPYCVDERADAAA